MRSLLRITLFVTAAALPSAARAEPCDEPAREPGLAAIGDAVADARAITPFGFDTFEGILREVYGPEARLLDRPRGRLPGHVDANDRFEYVKDGRVVRTQLGKRRFEQARMNAHIVAAAREMAESGVSFSGRSKDDRVNQTLWWMGYGGKMGARMGVKSSDAIRDVFENGHLYAFECATGNLLVYYKAILDRIGPEDFDVHFPKLRLFRWDIEDDDFTAAKKVGSFGEIWPGDHVYFDNPDFDPAHSAWQGENTIYLGGGTYFGHGIGVESGEKIASTLDSLRRPGATRKAAPDLQHLVRIDGGRIAALDQRPD